MIIDKSVYDNKMSMIIYLGDCYINFILALRYLRNSIASDYIYILNKSDCLLRLFMD